jgi:arylsulfatase A-like enzyme
MSRRAALAGLVLFVAALAAVPGPAQAQNAPPRPNILVIVTDDQPKGTLEAMPATRRLFIREGRVYPNAYVTTPLCCPSRASILTGRYAHNHGVLTQQPQSFDVRTTVARYLRQAGYLNAIAGKYLNRWGTRPDFTPVSPPYFDLWATTRPNAGGYFNTVFNLNGRLQTVKEYSTGYIGDKTIRFLRSFERRDMRPWFMYTAVVAPHAPNDPEGKHKRARVSAWPGDPAVFEGDRTDKPPYVQRREAGFDLGRRVRKRQLRTLMSVDDMIRKIFAELRANREDRKTLAFFLSDNGLLWAQHGLLNKTVPYLQSIRVPLLARWPARIPGGSRDDRLVANVDLAPTIAQVAGLGAASPPMDGRSLFSREWDRDHLLVEYFEGDTGIAPTWASITAPTHQYVEYYDEDGNETFREYYDLVRDPWQLVNTLGDFDPTNDPSPARLSELSARLAVERECVASLCP